MQPGCFIVRYHFDDRLYGDDVETSTLTSGGFTNLRRHHLL